MYTAMADLTRRCRPPYSTKTCSTKTCSRQRIRPSLCTSLCRQAGTACSTIVGDGGVVVDVDVDPVIGRTSLTRVDVGLHSSNSTVYVALGAGRWRKRCSRTVQGPCPGSTSSHRGIYAQTSSCLYIMPRRPTTKTAFDAAVRNQFQSYYDRRHSCH